MPQLNIARVTEQSGTEAHISRPFPRAMMGLSLGSPASRGRKLAATLGWLCANSVEALVLVGDDLARHTVRIRTGLDAASALARAHQEGDRLAAEVVHLIKEHRWRNVTVHRWGALLHEPRFPDSKREIASLHRRSEEFRALVAQSAAEYLERLGDRGAPPSVASAEALDLAQAYLLEEIAVFAMLLEIGWEVEVYPGPDLPALRALSLGLVDGAPPCFKRRNHIELTLRDEAGAL